MSDRHDVLHVVPRLFEAENHNYCLSHLRNNFVTTVVKHGVNSDASKGFVKKMFNKVAYTPSQL